MESSKADKPGEGRKSFQHKIGTDIGPGKVPISDFMLIRLGGPGNACIVL
jgi:hypothetical protein